MRDVAPVQNYLTSAPVPVINPRYNALSYTGTTPNYEDWETRHPAKNFVIGSAWVPGSVPTGIYQVADYFGSTITHQPAMLVNYPMYFEPGYLDTLWDWFHWIDDPMAYPTLNMNWHCKIELCCEDLARLKVMGDAADVQLGHIALLPTKYYQEGVIKEITVSYDSSDKIGKFIELKGSV